MRVHRPVLLLLLASGVAHAEGEGEDIAEAADVIRQFAPGDAVGLEKFIDQNPDEALSILLGRFNVDPGTHGLATLGGVRLEFAELKPLILAAAAETGVSAALIDAVIRTESGYRPRAVSRAGASGLMQLMPATAKEVGVRDVFDPRQNILGGARYLRRLYDRFGNIRLAVAAYNAGPGAVARYETIPPFPETKASVRTVMARYGKSKLNGLGTAD